MGCPHFRLQVGREAAPLLPRAPPPESCFPAPTARLPHGSPAVPAPEAMELQKGEPRFGGVPREPRFRALGSFVLGFQWGALFSGSR